MKKIFALGLALTLLLSTTACGKKETLEGQPEGYPDKVVEFIVPAAAGSWADNYTRALTNSMNIGGDTVVTNMAGGSQSIGLTELVSRPADGYTIGIAGASGLITQPITNPNIKYDVLSDFTYFMMSTDIVTSAIVVNGDSDINSLDDILEGIKNGNKYTYTTPNVGSQGHIGIISLFAQIGKHDNYDYLSSLTHVPSNSTNEVLTNLEGKHMDFGIYECGTLSTAIENGRKVKPLFVLYSEGSDYLKETPSALELCPYLEDLDAFASTMYFMVKKGTPTEILDWIKEKCNEAVEKEPYQELLKSNNATKDTFSSEEDIYKIIETQYRVFKDVIENYLN